MTCSKCGAVIRIIISHIKYTGKNNSWLDQSQQEGRALFIPTPLSMCSKFHPEKTIQFRRKLM
ncbi:hypothetical protein PAGA_b0410 [Pseudoalteromonas agarivorans DSM 14585]|uniref:Uncharacterized protein n=1 Tax=Pseudoalteromonas agarivorans DSM 14585 TaxID=1312369 RepID=A0ACA8E1Z7_9GAMM|nr:hypothetical protein PAGA_b0410 [Pseudoalteromonas agarivorans DSM 14585]